MVAPKPPEGGWKNWFTTHPYQHTKYPILRAERTTALYTQEYPESIPTPSFEYVEMWYGAGDCKMYASMNGQSPDFLWVSAIMSEPLWAAAVTDLFEHVINQKPPTPPEPVGSGWDDFDWSK